MVTRKPRDDARLDALVAKVQQDRSERERGYRAQALKMYPWVCGRCGREFTRANLRELTVHHRNHDHDYNPPDGSNWELLCVYCHDNEHARLIDAAAGGEATASADETPTSRPLSGLAELLKGKPQDR